MSDPTPASPPRAVRQPPPSAAEVVQQALAIDAPDPKAAAHQLIEKLASRYEGEVTDDDVARIVELIRSKSIEDSVAVEHARRTPPKRPRRLYRDVMVRLLALARERCGYPVPTAVDQDRRTAALLSVAGARDLAAMRLVLFCLDGERDLGLRRDGLLALLQRASGQDARGADLRVLLGTLQRQIANLVAPAKVKAPDARRLEAVAAVVGTVVEGERGVRIRVQQQLDEQLEARARDSRAAAEVATRLAAAEEAGRALALELEAAKRELDAMNAKLRARDEHWRIDKDQDLARVRGDLSRRISQEATEARELLDRESPNIPMALRRLADIERIVADAKSGR